MHGKLGPRLSKKKILKEKAADWLERPFSDEEIFKAIKLSGKDKVPSPNDFTAELFLANWPNIKLEVLKAVKNFFKQGKILKEINITHLCLIPKNQNAKTIEDFRPILLCNFIYKIIAKCISERLKVYLLELISNN